MRFIVGFVFAVLLLSQCAAAPMQWRHKKSYNRHRDVRQYQMARAARAIYQAAIANHTMSDSANNSISDINLKIKVGSKDIEVDRNDGTVLQKVPRTDKIRRQRIQEADVEDKAAETKAEIAKIAAEVEGMKSESASAKQGVKELESRIEAEGAEVKRKAAVALANKEAELEAKKKKEAEDEEEIKEGLQREEALEGEVEEKDAEIERLKAEAEAALSAAEEKDVEDVWIERNQTKVLLMELLALMEKQKKRGEAKVAEDAEILVEEKRTAKVIIGELTTQVEALELKLKTAESESAVLAKELELEKSSKLEEEKASEVALETEAEMRIHDAKVMGNMLGIAETRLAEKLAKAEMEANKLKNKVAELAPTTSAPTTAGAAGASKSGNATAAATSSKAVTNASVPATKKPIKVNLSFEIEPAELEAGQK